MYKFIQYWRSQHFFSNVLTLFTGIAVARIISFILMPVVAWIFVPQDYGVAALFVAVVAFLSAGSTLAYEQAILLPKNDNEANDIANVSLRLLINFCAIILVLCLILSIYPDTSPISPLSNWIFLIPVGILLIGLNNIAKNTAVRALRYKRVAASEVNLAIVTPTSRILFGLLSGSSAGGLILGYILGVLSQFLLLKDFVKWSQITDRKPNFKQTLSKYKDFALYTTPSAIIKNALDYMPIILLGIMYNMTVVGLYAFANRLIRAIVSIVNQAVKQAYIQKSVSILESNKTTRKALIKLTFVLMVIGAPLFIAIYFLSADIFSMIFGETWLEAGKYAKILAPWLFTEFIITPAAASYLVLRKQSLLLYIQILALLLRSCAFLFSYISNLNAYETLFFLSLAGIIENVTIALVALHITGKKQTVAY